MLGLLTPGLFGCSVALGRLDVHKGGRKTVSLLVTMVATTGLVSGEHLFFMSAVVASCVTLRFTLDADQLS